MAIQKFWFWHFSERRWAQILLLCPLFQNQGAAFSLDACSLFPQHVLAIIPLICSVKVQQPFPRQWVQVLAAAHGFASGKHYLRNPGAMGGSSDACLQIFLVVESIHTIQGQLRQVLTPAHGFSSDRSYGLSWDNEGRTWHLFTSLIEAASAAWSLRWHQWLTPAPRAPTGGALLPGSAHREKKALNGGPACLFVSLFFFFLMVACPSGRPRLLQTIPSVSTTWPLQTVSAHLTLALPLDLTSRSWASAFGPHQYWQRHVSGWELKGRSAESLCRVLSILPSMTLLLLSPVRLWSSPSI